MKRLVAAAIASLALAGCVAQDQRISTMCESGQGDIMINSRLCDGVNRICDNKHYAHQNITILNRSSTAAAVEIRYSDGTVDKRIMPARSNLLVEKPIGTGVKVSSQC